MDESNDNLKHHCGVAGFFSAEPANLPEKLFYSLFSLQHRGQESAGISYRENGKTISYKDLGMVSAVLSRYLTKQRLTSAGIGHVRYSTRGGNRLENAQPISVTCNKGDIALAHNGNISNAAKLHSELTETGSIFQTTSDTELILHMISLSRKTSFFEAFTETLERLEGAFSMVLIHDDSLIVVRDPNGFRPLYIGTKDGITAAASETCALETLNMTEYRQVEPGEVIVVNKKGLKSSFLKSSNSISQCIFELIYFARPDSRVFDESVHGTRKRMGAALWECDPVKGDVVVPVPDSGNNAAIGYAEASGIPFDHGLTRNHYAGRSFIMPTTAQRELAVRMKLHPIREAIAGKKIILVDDSLVRGTTSKILVKMLKDAGASEVHLRLSSPELKWPCFFGIDIPTRQELISNSKTPQEIAEYIGADSVMFLPVEKLKSCVSESDKYCYACFCGDYPVKAE
ncbi:MAG: amidophosphoribosyltransferase [Spirochaetales bacterium]|uniref:Amidophosphoribosyltransferase n=1 Tax=Candidatus Thalassospirochaeta sargassi TaxID=3119039 RepID=A0AAJ1IFG3_9SPIO|nr:amidophosphoribosyltransferase [Spirochaetales bacterium]